jgi:2-polyprenyl-6-methoxyphenol hydroxylase-like FAD-dependent oxidoreductase
VKVLISGAGIAGPTLAYWLLRYGFEPTLVEQAPRLRTGGYMIDFWGVGFEVADRMGLVPMLMRRGYVVEEVRLVDSRGRRVGGFSADVFRRATKGRYVSLPRGTLAAAIYDGIADKVESIFSDSIARVEQADRGVRVEFDRAPPRDFDLVVGADGLHSNLRRLVFGEQSRFERYIGYAVAAFEVVGYRPRDDLVYVGYGQPGKQVARFAMSGDRTMFLFVFADGQAGRGDPGNIEAQKMLLRRTFAGVGWECPRILDAMESCESIYLDRVSQIRMDRWTKGRVALVGDAASCPSLLAGEGAALAMAAAYVLAGELRRGGADYAGAFARYEACLRPFIAGKQRTAEAFASSFAPRSAIGLFLRNLVTRAMVLPLVADLALGRSVRDDFLLPDYSLPGSG